MTANFFRDKKFWYIIAALAVVIIGIVVFVWYKRKKAAERLANPTGTGSNNGALVKTTMYNASVFPLKNGSRGNEVLTLQKYLNENVLSKQIRNGFVAPLADLALDGIWGPRTDEVVKTKLGLSAIDETYYKKIVLGL